MTIEERVAKLDETIGVWRLATVGLGLVLLALALALLVFGTILCWKGNKAAIPDLIRARRIELIAPDGQTSVLLQSIDDGGGLLTVYNAEGKRVANIIGSADGGRLAVYNAKGKRAASIDARGGGGVLAVCNADEKRVAVIAATDSGGWLSIINAEGEWVASIDATGGGGNLDIYNAKGHMVAYILSDKSNCGRVGVCDAYGKVVDKLPGNR